MKKNVMMRVAAMLLVCVLASTCGISGTFAKYVTSTSSQDQARVAKFGVTISADFSKTFLEQYTTTNAWTGDNGVSVESTTDVVAPGTNGSLADFVVAGTPEVDVAVTYKVKTFTLENWDADGDEYCPIIFNVNGVLYYIGKDGITDVAGLQTAVINAIEGSAEKYNAGTDLSTVVFEDLAVSWQWQFDNNTVGFVGADNQNDTQDTLLGNWELLGKAAPTISIEIECTITQID